MKFFLMGYMGAGKSTIGKNLAAFLGIEFYDLDTEIERQENMPVPELFRKKGEIYFRKKEKQVLENFLNLKDNLVLGLGGGTPCYGENSKLIEEAKDVVSIYLKANPNFLADRLFDEKETRPLIAHLNTFDELQDFVRKHLFERTFYYAQADKIIDIENKSPETIVREIQKALN